MKNYIAPEYANNVLESKDIITESVDNGVVQRVESRYDPESNENIDVTVFSTSGSRIF